MNVDDIVKLALVFAVTFAIVGISYQIMRVIGKLADTIQDLRRAAQNISNASDMVLEDYGKIRGLLDRLLSIVENIAVPLKAIGWIADKLPRRTPEPSAVEEEQKIENE
ncbi:hypothetical protein KC640_01755 [Candidatus Dojkabacteria bacterium]|uniref:DUF948 domain-containing protein n=1 Tax=Candidatus Dojkabacteria bacterium TaxID=2099670 RepID=A0A955L0F3_9BACT|nr:hypothetical protein [Candidatus Dojkabacteria bacterium]